MKNVSHLKFSLFWGLFFCCNVTLLAQINDEVEETDKVVEDIDYSQLQPVDKLLDYNFHSPEVQAYFEQIGHARSNYGEKSFLKLKPLTGIEIKFDQNRVLKQLEYDASYQYEMPYGLKTNMKYRKVKKMLGKKKVNGNRRTIILMDNWLEVAVHYPKKGPRKSIQRITRFSMRPDKFCSLCGETIQKEKDSFWQAFTDSLNKVQDGQRKFDRIAAEKIAKERREKEEKAARDRIAYEKRERDQIADYNRKEKEHKKAILEANPICTDLSDVINAGPDFEIYVGQQISQDIDPNIQLHKYSSRKIIPGFKSAEITNQLIVAFMMSISTYEGSLNFSSRSKAQEFYFNIIDQIMHCDDYIEEKKIQKTESALMQNSFTMSSSERYGQKVNVVLKLEAVSSIELRMTIRISDE